jgi:hypothetical protein
LNLFYGFVAEGKLDMPNACSGNGSSRHDPFCWLTADACDEIEIVVVVEDHETGGLSCSSDQEVPNLGTPLLAPVGKLVLHFNGSIQNQLIYGHERPP